MERKSTFKFDYEIKEIVSYIAELNMMIIRDSTLCYKLVNLRDNSAGPLTIESRAYWSLTNIYAVYPRDKKKTSFEIISYDEENIYTSTFDLNRMIIKFLSVNAHSLQGEAQKTIE